jgi:hypothetical protein
MNRGVYLLAILVILQVSLYVPSLQAQLSAGGAPRSFLYTLPQLPETVLNLPMPDLSDRNKEDSIHPSPYCFGIVLPLEVDCGTTGSWSSLPDDQAIWRVMIKASGALALSVYFDRFHIPEGGKLFLYDPLRQQVIGAFTSRNNPASGYFATELIQGDELILEYTGPPGEESRPDLHINEIAYAYRGVHFSDPEIDNPNLTPCEVNVNCPEGSYWQYHKDGVARIQVKRDGKTYWCSGSVINNTSQDRTPYIITANHCAYNSTQAEQQMWVFYFNYEAPTCSNKYPKPRTLTGGNMKAQSGGTLVAGSDFYLVQMNDVIPDTFHVFYNGWSRLESPVSPSGVCIHHPNGDIKKISTYTTPLVSTHWEGSTNETHWMVKWSPTQSGYGVTEGGSSGSPMFDPQGRIVGTLSGGLSACDSTSRDEPDYFGKISFSWASNGNMPTRRLRDWLDPTGTNAMTLEGVYLGIEEAEAKRTFVVYPNPCQGSVTISHQMVSGELKVTLFDLPGKMQMTKVFRLSGNETLNLDLRDLATGIYLLRAESDNVVYTRKIIKE